MWFKPHMSLTLNHKFSKFPKITKYFFIVKTRHWPQHIIFWWSNSFRQTNKYFDCYFEFYFRKLWKAALILTHHLPSTASSTAIRLWSARLAGCGAGRPGPWRLSWQLLPGWMPMEPGCRRICGKAWMLDWCRSDRQGGRRQASRSLPDKDQIYIRSPDRRLIFRSWWADDSA